MKPSRRLASRWLLALAGLVLATVALGASEVAGVVLHAADSVLRDDERDDADPHSVAHRMAEWRRTCEAAKIGRRCAE